MLDNTLFFNSNEIKRAVVNEVLQEVYHALKEKGYNPVNQLVGYLVTDDPSYISSYNNSRNKILGLDKNEIFTALVERYFEE